MLCAGRQQKNNEMFERNSTTKSLCLTIIVMLPFAALAQTEGALGAGLKQCAGIADDAARLSCFDALVLVTGSEQQATAGTPAAAPAAEPAAAAEPAVAAVPAVEQAVEPISDEIGMSSIRKDEEYEPKKYSARVTRCQENEQSGQYYFFFENGQVWKQSKYRRLRWKDCSFDVEVSKGAFGYDMYIPEKDRKIRITRIR